MAKKHLWVRNSALTRLTGIRGTCLDCGEARTGPLRGGICPGVRKQPVAHTGITKDK